MQMSLLQWVQEQVNDHIPVKSNQPPAVLVSPQLHVTIWLKRSNRHKKSFEVQVVSVNGAKLSFVFSCI